MIPAYPPLKKWFLLLQSSADSGMLLSMEDMQMTINALYNMDEVTVLFDTDPLTGEQAECDQEWTGEPEKSEF